MSNHYSIKTALLDAKQKHIDPLDAHVILTFVLNESRTNIIAYPEKVLDENQIIQYKNLLEHRSRHEPLAYLTGRKEFWSLSLNVSKDVLVPRPETECLVELALTHIPQQTSFDILEMATGSGAIACALANERSNITILATDYCEEALNIAEKNRAMLSLNNITLLQSDWYSALQNKHFDMIIANPPYLSEDDPHLQKELLFEPRGALVSGETGFEAFEAIIRDASAHLKPGGLLLLEHGYNQSEKLQHMLTQHNFTSIETTLDYAGIPRVTSARMNQNDIRII